ncbi:hypothetical protein JKF63_07487 [Porcisia hertigi]|uniref:Uncharacterized protein n=1 Tax=Porcisia hertigi TaxID=2761500 RepID=A0A836LGE8_9TRYP|nr:hypothetical protein JKF63_07487 [Porcisia hertigi]
MPLTVSCRSAADAARGGGFAAASGAGHASSAGSLTATINFKDAVGMLWYALLLLQQSKSSHLERRRQRIWSGVKGIEEDPPHGKDTVDVVEGALLRSTDVATNGGGGASKVNIGAVYAGAPPSPSTTFLSPTPEQPGDCDFEAWGQVDWTLLAAHVYALTRELHSALALRRIVVEDIYKEIFHCNRCKMCTAYALQHAEALNSYAQEAQEEGRRGGAARQQTLLTSTSSLGGNRLAGAVSALQAAPSTAHALLGTGGHEVCPAVMATVQGPASSSHISGHADEGTAPSSASVPSDMVASSLASQQRHGTAMMSQAAVASLPVRSSPTGGEQTRAAVASVGVAGSLASAEAGTAARALGTSSSCPPLGHPNVLGCSAPGGMGRGGATDPSQLPTLQPHARSGDVAGALEHSSLSVTGERAAMPGETRGPDAAHRADHVVAPSTTSASLPFEPDPLDAPWYALWSSLPSPQARAQLHLLRYATPLSLENFSSLLEQFFMVDGADDFLSPVHAATIMEFAGVRSGPYNTIVRSPLSLAEVRRYIAESHRQYTRAAVMTHPSVAESLAGYVSTAQSVSGTHTLVSASASLTPSALEASHAPVGSSGFPAPSTTATMKAEYRGLRRGGILSSEALGNDVRSLLDSTASSERRVLTLAELERSVWHVAANCVFFNAPESRYPRTARHFAAACIAIMTRYCEKQLGATFYTA